MSSKFWKKALSVLTGGVSNAVEAIVDKDKSTQEKIQEVTRSIGTAGFGGSNGVLNDNAADAVGGFLSGGVNTAINVLADGNKNFGEKLVDVTKVGINGAFSGGITNAMSPTLGETVAVAAGSGGSNVIPEIPFNGQTLNEQLTEHLDGTVLDDVMSGDIDALKDDVGISSDDGIKGVLGKLVEWLTGETKMKLQDKYSQLAEQRQQDYEQLTYDRNRADALSDLAEQRAYDENIYNLYQSPAAQARQLEEAGLSPWALGQVSGVGQTAGSSANVAAPANGAAITPSVGQADSPLMQAMQAIQTLGGARKNNAEIRQIGLQNDPKSWFNIDTHKMNQANVDNVIATTQDVYSTMFNRYQTFWEGVRRYNYEHSDADPNFRSSRYNAAMLEHKAAHYKQVFDLELMMQRANVSGAWANYWRTCMSTAKVVAETTQIKQQTESEKARTKILQNDAKDEVLETKNNTLKYESVSKAFQAYADSLEMSMMVTNEEQLRANFKLQLLIDNSLKSFEKETAEGRFKLLIHNPEIRDWYIFATMQDKLTLNTQYRTAVDLHAKPAIRKVLDIAGIRRFLRFAPHFQ